MMKPILAPLLLAAMGIAMSADAQVPVPSPPSVDARSYLVIDFNSGREIAALEPDTPVEPASITKLMTAYVVFREIAAGRTTLDDEVLVSEEAWRTGGSRMFIDVNTRIRVEDLLRGMIIQSGNDASVALAEHVAGTEDTFAELMNAHAARLGMVNSNFTNSTGWPDEALYTTARDIATLSRALIMEFPEFYSWYSEREFTWNNIRQTNRNNLLWRDSSVDGLKTGHTESAGYCLVTSALRNDMRLISVVLGTNSERARADISQALLNYGFRFFETHRLYAAGTELTRARVWKGALEEVPVGVGDDLWITIPRGRYRDLDARMDLRVETVAPVAEAEELGRVRVTLDDREIADLSLHALVPVAQGSLWRRLSDTVRLWFE
jgi:serine-type D-Ala-D-Ala carboxypeptidase (penicillin-binding protein 5/6)